MKIAREIREKRKTLKNIWFYFSVFSVFCGQTFLGFETLQLLDRSVMERSEISLIFNF
jgi:hypothetical protein